MKVSIWIAGSLAALAMAACRNGALPRPVEIFPEDNCSNCRMAITQTRFASQVITERGAVHKFDDLACLDEFLKKNPDGKIIVTYVRDYDADVWVRSDSCTVVQTNLSTPMGSGRIAISDHGRAMEIQALHPYAGR